MQAFWNFFFPALTGMVGFWATLSLNIPDFTRYAKSQKAQINGQAIGLATFNDIVFFYWCGGYFCNSYYLWRNNLGSIGACRKI